MNRIPLAISLALCLTACSPTPPKPAKHTFTDDIRCAYTLPLNQGRTSTCWAYGCASLLESEWLAAHPGDTVRLSPMYAVRQKYLKQFDAYYYSCGREEIRNGGLGHSFLRVLDEDGLLPLEAYRGRRPEIRMHDHRKLLKRLKTIAAEAVRHSDFAGGRTRAIALLDEQMGTVPDTFLYRGKRYTARSFADSLRFRADDYVQWTSFTHHPFYTSFILEAPDNWEHRPYFNLPLDELEQCVRRALAEGRTVVWHGDVSEEGFNARQGVAVWNEHPVTQQMRQQAFEHFLTTDDHIMHLVGTAHDEAGRFYYLLKNSYGRRGTYGGLIYMSEDYFRMKTLSVLLRKEG